MAIILDDEKKRLIDALAGVKTKSPNEPGTSEAIDEISGATQTRETLNPRNSLSFIDKLLVNPQADRLADIVAPIQKQAQDSLTQQVNNFRSIPRAVQAVNPLTSSKRIIEMLSNPQQGIENATDDASAMTNVAKQLLTELSRAPLALERGLMPPDDMSHPEAAMKAFLRPEEVPAGFAAQFIGDKVLPKTNIPYKKPSNFLEEGFEKTFGTSAQNIPRILTAAVGGTLADLAAFEVGTGSAISRISKTVKEAQMSGAVKDAEKMLDKVTPQFVSELEAKGAFPKDWTDADKFGRTKIFLREKVLGSKQEGQILNPEVSDFLLKKQNPLNKIFNKKGQAVLPGPEDLPKPSTESIVGAGAESLSKIIPIGTPKEPSKQLPPLGQPSQLTHETESGILPKTGEKFSARFYKSRESAPRYKDNRFGQEFEPSGAYVGITSKGVQEGLSKEHYDTGVIELNNPLVIEHKGTDASGWKKDLMEKYGGKTGKKLTEAIKRAGYDGIITINSKNKIISETIAFDTTSLKKEPEGSRAVSQPTAETTDTGGLNNNARPLNFEETIEYHGTSPENAKKILKEGKFKIGGGQKGVSTTQGYEEALDYAGGNPEGVIAVRIKKNAPMLGVPGKDFITGTGSFSPDDVIPVEIAKNKKQAEVVEPITQQTLSKSGVTDANYKDFIDLPPSKINEAQYITARQIANYRERGDLVPIKDIQDDYRNWFSKMTDEEWIDQNKLHQENRAAAQKANIKGVSFVTGKPPAEPPKTTFEQPEPSPEEPKKTQKEIVTDAVKEAPKSIKQIADETKIVEPNIRRILGVGTKEGVFERVDKGVYILRNNGKDTAYIIPGDSVEVLPRLAEEGFKSDMVFLDIPYDTPAVKGGNRGVKYSLVSVDQFKTVIDSISKIVKTEDSPVVYMFSQAKSGREAMQKYTDVILDAGFKPVARGEYTKLQKDGLTQVRNMRGEVIVPEGIIVLNKSGQFNLKEDGGLNFKLVRPKGYQTEKPAEMLNKLIRMTTGDGEVVLDPFAGSGVTIAEAVKTGRVGVGIEKSEKAIQEHIKPKIEGSYKEQKNTPIDLSKYKKVSYNGEDYHLLETLDKTRGKKKALLIAPGSNVFVDDLGIFRPNENEKNIQAGGFWTNLESLGKPVGVDAKPKAAINSDDEWDQDITPEKSNKEHSIEDQAEMEIEMMYATKGAHPLESAMKDLGKIRTSEYGMEEGMKEIPPRFKSDRGRPISEIRRALEEDYGLTYDTDSELRAALKELGNSEQKFQLSSEVQRHLRSKPNVERLGKKLAEKIPPSAYKRIIYSNVGLKVKSTPFSTTREKMLKYILKAQEKGSQKGFMAGKKFIRQERRLKEAQEKAEREAAQRFTPEQRKQLFVEAMKKGLVVKLDNGKYQQKYKGILQYYKQASFDEIVNYIHALKGEPGNPPKLLKLYGDINSDTEAIKLINELSSEWRDINNLELRTLDTPRQIEKVTGLDAWDENNVLMHNTFDVIAGADAARFDEFNERLRDLHKNVSGFVRDTKASAEAMRKAEEGEPLNPEETKAVEYIREQNAELIRRANDIRAKLGRKPIPTRQNYLTHMREYNLLVKLFKGDTKQIDTLTNEQLDAIRKNDFTKPNAKFNPHALKRTGEKTKYDLVGNYEKYLETMLYEIYLSPAIAHSRKFSDYALLRQPNMYKSINRLLNELAGKPSVYDELLRPIVSNSIVKWVRSQIAKNALIGNINFNLVNMANITTSSGELGVYALKGLRAFLGDAELRALAFKESSVLKSRRSQFDADVKAVSVFNPESLDKLTAVEKGKVAGKQLQYLAEGLTRIIEYNNVGSTWVGAYLKGTQVYKMPHERALKYADTIARRTQVGYRSYELPAAMRSDTGKLFLQFQSWTFNAMNHLIYDLKLGNIPNSVIKPFTKDNRPTDVEYRKFFILLAILMLTNEIYKRFGWREPTSLASAIPRASFPAGRVIQSAAVSTGADNVVNRIMGKDVVEHKPETLNKARFRTASAVLAPFGGVQAARLFEGSILPKKDYTKDIREIYKQAELEKDFDKKHELKAKAREMAKEKGLNAKKIHDSAVQSLRRERREQQGPKRKLTAEQLRQIDEILK